MALLLRQHQKLLSVFAPVNLVRHASLVREKTLVNGKWVGAANGKEFNVYNPSDGSICGKAPAMNVSDTEEVVKAAHNAFFSWSQTTAKERSLLLRKWFYKVAENTQEIAQILSTESGKPVSEALGEVTYGNSFLEWFSEEARRIHGEVLSSPARNRELFHIKQPIGVAALITPWNFPLAMITRKAGAALAAGCTCVIKPAEDTPLTALALAQCAQDAGIPDGVINVITAPREESASIGQFLCESRLIAGITFTGSTEVGKILYKQCANTVKRLSLELGGNAPFIVFDSADLNKAVEGAMVSKFRNCGQTCVSANRFLIQETIYDDFVCKLSQALQDEIEIGHPSAKSVKKHHLGPLINKSQLQKVDSFVKDAVQKGAKVLHGGKQASNVGELFYEPTLLANLTEDMMCYRDEVFGPVIPVIKFKTEDEAIKIANDTFRGLAGYFYTSDISQTWRVAKKLEVGMIGINEGLISTAEAAFGGVKESGLGREGSHYGLDEFLNIKYMCMGNLQV